MKLMAEIYFYFSMYIFREYLYLWRQHRHAAVSKNDRPICPKLVHSTMRLCSGTLSCVFLKLCVEPAHLINTVCWMQGYNPTIFYPKRTDKPLYHSLTTQCIKMGIPLVNDALASTTEVSKRFDVIVDALFGFSFRGPPRPEFADFIKTIIDSRLPVVSVDVPSGIWCILSSPSFVLIVF